ncbi:hypothetical protein K437DRAFT_258915 [Tilletiaria anomala UBC 951]|uniref:Phosphoglycerate mutase-like protein n=1 Tax=Tilletiaria anomala (strain ATCC 24038 / CBS 436.72 / UBC 951) TaxID=1037660 RepID=A0A066VE58_TILAU|nr:uncharacterized protein K437DRAFT_258915 [Tilletiaria anomala UBC 951]KDN39746.1 hypothetical protein K437DRAFT_258915 [Tilletiaria anomala UBC 951]
MTSQRAPVSTEQWPWPAPKFTFETLNGFFLYDEEVQPPQLPPLAENFGLRQDKTWKQLVDTLTELNAFAKNGEQYKLIFAGRHGEGWHNVAEAKYGTEAWDGKWALLDGDGQMTWGPDPPLTPLGVSQAQAVNSMWKRLLSEAPPNDEDRPPLPTILFSSPMQRSAVTLRMTYDGVLLGANTIEGRAPLVPRMRELWRETLTTHMCDRRADKTVIQQRFPEFEIEESMTEKDELFMEVLEEDATSAIRLRHSLSQTFTESEGHQIIGITLHSGVMLGLMTAVGHAVFKPKICGVVPMIVKATPVK